MPEDVITAPSAEQTQAESSPATNHQEVLNALSDEQRRVWRMSGKLPEKVSSGKADSAPASSESASASEADKSVQEKSRKRDTEETRINELLADIKAAGFTPASLKTFRKEAALQSKPAESAPAKAPEMKAETNTLEAPQEPDMKDAKYTGADGWEKYEADVRKFNRDYAEYASKKAVQDFQENQQKAQELRRVQEQITRGREKYPDFDEKSIPVMEGLAADPKSPVFEMVGRSPVFEHLVYVIGGEKDEFLALAKADPWAAVSKAAVMQALIMEELNGTKGGEKPRNTDGTFVKSDTPVKKVTGAPPPPSEVGGTAAAPGDKVGEAVQKRDFASYRAEMNRREMASKRS